MIVQGNILKMQTVPEEVVQYSLPVGEKLIPMNQLIGMKLRMRFLHQINCIKCGKTTKKSFNQGFCYPCFLTAPENDPGVYRPELDQAHLGISRDMEYAKKYSLIEHTVYLSVTSGLKVGVTRTQNLLTRWIDQGAVRAVRIAETPYRNLAGQIELSLKSHFDDRTHWQNMLTNRIDNSYDLIAQKESLNEFLQSELKQYLLDEKTIYCFNYPVSFYPLKVRSHDLDKLNNLEGVLTGIKGQYLLFGNIVINVRKYQGYNISLEVE